MQRCEVPGGMRVGAGAGVEYLVLGEATKSVVGGAFR